jgi:formylglycine-generating enzyme required for sulfatase activity
MFLASGAAIAGCFSRPSVPDAVVGGGMGGSTTSVRPGEMVSIPGGTFQMGDGNYLSNFPREVTVAPFQLDAMEVTVDGYASCVSAGRCSIEHVNGGGPGTHLVRSPLCNWGVPGKNLHPINCVDWSQANAYCTWASKRLPTEEEWEYAARGGARVYVYPWGNDPPDTQLCWRRWQSHEGTCRVGSYPAGAFGLHDMAGNVWELTAGLYDPFLHDHHVMRGGSLVSENAQDVRGALRAAQRDSDRAPNVGFRCAR